MKIEIKKALLEGHSPEVIVEAVHANHPHLDKRNPANKTDRKDLADHIKSTRAHRDSFRAQGRDPKQPFQNLPDKTANYADNYARGLSQKGGPYLADELRNFDVEKSLKVREAAPRVISSAKK